MPLFAPILSLVFMVLGSGFFMSFVSLYFNDQNLSAFHIGLAQSAFYLGLLVSSLRSERLIGRIGHIRALTATCGLLSAVTLVLFFVSAPQWFVFRFIAGICVGCFYVAAESWLLTEYPSANRGSALAVYSIAIYSAQALSQLFLPFTENNAPTAFTISGIFISLAVIPVAVGRHAGPAPSVAEPHSLLKYFKLSPLGVIGCFLSGMLLSTLYGYMPLYVEARGFNPGFLMTVLIAGGALLQWPIGRASDSMDRRKVLVALAIFGIAMSFGLAFSSTLIFFVLFLFFMGGFIFTIYPVAMVLGCDCVPSSGILKMTGVLLFAYGLGAVVGPLTTPLLKGIGPSYIIVMLILYCVLLFGVGLYALITKEKIKLEEQSVFTVIPTGPIVESLHPSTAEESISGK